MALAFNPDRSDSRDGRFKFSEVIAALSHALDMVEGQPEGHAVRTCLIGMRLAKELKLSGEDRSALFYALLLKDLGCSNNAAKVCYLFGADDRTVKRDLKTTQWTRFSSSAAYVARNVLPEGSLLRRALQFCRVVAAGQPAARELISLRCERGANIVRRLGLPERTAEAIYSLDEHYNGRGHPHGLKGEQIPLFGRILSLAQTVEVFAATQGLEAGFDVARQRSGSWFDPALVKVFRSLRSDDGFWAKVKDADPAPHLADWEPEDRVLFADARRLDDVAEAFGQVIDAKSPWTFCHSTGVAEVAVGIAGVMGLDPGTVRTLRRAALLHDIGKLGISNLILDKPGRLTPDEVTEMRRHAGYGQSILERVAGFRDIAPLAAAHHERLDGTGYHRGLSGSRLTVPVRILCVADMYEALAAKRPYRKDLSAEDVLNIIQQNTGPGLCPTAVAALKVFLDQSGFTPIQLAA